MSVIDGSDWDGLKKFNINELYKVSPGAKPKATPAAAAAASTAEEDKAVEAEDKTA